MLALLLAWVSATSASPPPGAPSERPDSARRIALRQALDSFSAAFVRADAEALDRLLASDYVHTNGGTGTVLDRARWLDYVRRRHADLRSGRTQVERYEWVGTTIRWHPVTAVVSGQVVSEGTQDGIPFTSRLQVTQVWIRVGERWLRAAFHDSPVPGP
jgi:hypothetical protein